MSPKCLFVDFRGRDCDNDALENSNFCSIHDDSSGLLRWLEGMKTVGELVAGATALVAFGQELLKLWGPHMAALESSQAAALSALVDRAETLQRIVELLGPDGPDPSELSNLVDEFESIATAFGQWVSTSRRLISGSQRVPARASDQA